MMPLLPERGPWWLHVWQVVRGLLLAYAAIGVLMWCFQGSLVYPGAPVLHPWGALVVKRPDLTLRGWITRPEGADALVVFGGNAMNVSEVGSAWKGCTSDAIYALAYRGFEGQPGTPNERDLVADGVALVRQVQSTHTHVRIVGISLGTGVAAQVAALTRPERLLLITPFDRLDTVAQDHYPWLPVRWLMRDHYDSLSAVRKLQGIPVALLQADQDDVIGASHTRALAAAIPGGPVAWMHVQTTHDGVWGDGGLCRFVRDQTQPTPLSAPATLARATEGADKGKH